MKRFPILVATLIFSFLLQANHGIAVSFSEMSGMMPGCGLDMQPAKPQDKCSCCILSQADRSNTKNFSGATNFSPALPNHHFEKHVFSTKSVRGKKNRSKFYPRNLWLKTVVQNK